MAWIRSQDKKRLVKCMFFEIGQKTPTIYGYTINDCFTLGTYSTEEKTLKVLDMIQETIIHNETVYAHKFSGSGVRDYDVFQMPNDEEV